MSRRPSSTVGPFRLNAGGSEAIFQGFANNEGQQQTKHMAAENILPRNYETRPPARNREMDDRGRASDDREKINSVIGLARCVESFSATSGLAGGGREPPEARGTGAGTESTSTTLKPRCRRYASPARGYGMFHPISETRCPLALCFSSDNLATLAAMRWPSSLASLIVLLRARLSFAAPFLPAACRPLFDPESACPGNPRQLPLLDLRRAPL
jgi:hypothetical protein